MNKVNLAITCTRHFDMMYFFIYFYLNVRRPNIIFSVSLCAHFQSYLKSHVVKRILSYLERNFELGLLFYDL